MLTIRPLLDAKQTFRVGMSAIPRKVDVVFFCYPLVIICSLIVARSCSSEVLLPFVSPHCGTATSEKVAILMDFSNGGGRSKCPPNVHPMTTVYRPMPTLVDSLGITQGIV